MPINESTGLRTAKLTTGFVPTFPAGSVLDFYSGARPASADAGPTGTLLASCVLPSNPWGVPAGGSVAKSGTWTFAGLPAAGSGTDIGWARLRTSGDAGGISTTLPRADFVVSSTTGGGDLTMSNTNVADGQALEVGTLSIT